MFTQHIRQDYCSRSLCIDDEMMMTIVSFFSDRPFLQSWPFLCLLSSAKLPSLTHSQSLRDKIIVPPPPPLPPPPSLFLLHRHKSHRSIMNII